MSIRRKLISKIAKKTIKSKKVGRTVGKAMSAKQKAALMKAVKASAAKRSKGKAIKLTGKMASKTVIKGANKRAIKAGRKQAVKLLTKNVKGNKAGKKAIAKAANKALKTGKTVKLASKTAKMSTKKKVGLALLGAAGAQGAMASNTMKKQNARMAKWNREQKLERRQNSKRGRGRSISSYKRAKSQ